MPLTRLSVPRHLPASRARALAEAVQAGLVATCQVPPDDLFQLITRFDPEDMILDPHFGGVQRSADACIAEITFLTGRSDEQKRALYRFVAQQAVEAGFRPDDVMVALIENTRMDWSLGHGVAYADHVARQRATSAGDTPASNRPD